MAQASDFPNSRQLRELGTFRAVLLLISCALVVAGSIAITEPASARIQRQAGVGSTAARSGAAIAVKQVARDKKAARAKKSKKARKAAARRHLARRPVKVLFSCRYGWSVATPNPATYTGLSVNSSARSALTSS
ncbi:MAG TPA: hypothetical protein PKX56_11230, partial [Marmoricola sp.]|nr:hypothetical protein [Marmoricola sp.]